MLETLSDSEHLEIGVKPGDVLAGKYRVERVLGAGGMGVVVAAHHLQLDEKVALKFLRPAALGDADAVARFDREARAAVKIKSEHVARVIDVATLPDGAPYMVMEYLEGGDLSAWVEQRGPLPVEQAIEFVLQASVAVAEAHALGIVHRDLKPANLFCVRRADGQLSIKVLDFGISKLTEASGMAMTKTSSLMGSPFYMSPEQMRSSKDVDAQADIWALGIIVFELIVGRPPFQANSITELAIKVSSERTPSIRGWRPEVPGGLEAVVEKCLEKDRSHRYANVAELAQALLPFAPKRAAASVDRISGILQAAGLSSSARSLPPSSQDPGALAGWDVARARANDPRTVRPQDGDPGRPRGRVRPGRRRGVGAPLEPSAVARRAGCGRQSGERARRSQGRRRRARPARPGSVGRGARRAARRGGGPSASRRRLRPPLRTRAPGSSRRRSGRPAPGTRSAGAPRLLLPRLPRRRMPRDPAAIRRT